MLLALYQRTSTKTLFSSTNATDCPKHLKRPYPKINSLLRSSLFSWASGILSQRSGRKTFASGPKTSMLRWMAQVEVLYALVSQAPLWNLTLRYPILVPPGRNKPLNVSPSGGTTLSTSPETGGHSLRPSLIQACRYGNALASESWIGLEILPLCTPSSISALKRQSALDVVIKKRIVTLIAVAVVSDPANLFRSLSV